MTLTPLQQATVEDCKDCKKVVEIEYTNGYVLCSGIPKKPHITSTGEPDCIRLCIPDNKTDETHEHNLKVHEAIEICHALIFAITVYNGVTWK